MVDCVCHGRIKASWIAADCSNLSRLHISRGWEFLCTASKLHFFLFSNAISKRAAWRSPTLTAAPSLSRNVIKTAPNRVSADTSPMMDLQWYTWLYYRYASDHIIHFFPFHLKANKTCRILDFMPCRSLERCTHDVECAYGKCTTWGLPVT